MNKRIQELAIKTDAWCDQNVKDGDGYNAKWEQKFAELIVNECLRMIENEAAQYSEPVWAIELVNDIKEHFGVEE